MSEIDEAILLSSLFKYENMNVQIAMRCVNCEYMGEISFIFKDNRVSLGIAEYSEFRNLILLTIIEEEEEKGNAVSISIIGNYKVSLLGNTGMIRVEKDDVIICENSIDYWIKFFNRFNAAVDYKLSFLKKYHCYAGLIHSRIVNYYLNMLCETDNTDFFTIDFLRDDIINLGSSLLPKNNDEITCQYSTMDYNVCYIINSEIRLNSVYIIYLDVYM